MSMVFCRGCGKEIHESAPTCPHCGAPQEAHPGGRNGRNVGKLIAWGFVWALVFWVTAEFLIGMAAGVLDPAAAGDAGRRAGEATAGPFFIISIFLSAILTAIGVLPGTRKM